MKTRSGGEPPPGGLPHEVTGLGGPVPAARGAQAEPEAGQALAALYETHYRSMVRLAALLIADLATAEEIVQESFAAVHGLRHALSDTDAALGYLRRAVVQRSRTAARPEPGEAAGPQAAGPQADRALPGSAVVSALRALPVRQREVLVLRYFADLPEAEIASATGISAAAVRSEAARAISALHAELRPAGLGEDGTDQASG
jgi:RNA polymerase sigma factor (sigma-70 family)